MKRSKYTIALVVALLLSNACTKDFEAINTNPNNPSIDQAEPDQLLTNSIEGLTDLIFSDIGQNLGSCWVQQLAMVQYTELDRYIYNPGISNNIFNSLYADIGMDIETIRRISVERGLNNYKAISYILKTYDVSLITDMFGDVPYTQAWKAIDDISATLPKYDSQESIYRDMIAKLDTANMMLGTGNDNVMGDILFTGDLSKWKKFANSLRLRLLLRMSARDETFVTSEMRKMIANPDIYPVFEDNSDNAALIYLGSEPNNNPFNDNSKYNDNLRVSKTIIDMMWTNNPHVDYRLFVYALSPNSLPNEWVGLPNGLLSDDAANYNGNGLNNTSKMGNYFIQPSAPGMLMSFAELQFILAEAAAKDYIPGGLAEAETYYTNGIYGSYRQFESAMMENTPLQWKETNWTADSMANNYILSGGAKFDNSSVNAALQLIGKERWLATFDQGIQAFIEYRRTGIPDLVAPEQSQNGGLVPSRYPYPSDEMSKNNANLMKAIELQGFSFYDDMNAKVWWDVDGK